LIFCFTNFLFDFLGHALWRKLLEIILPSTKKSSNATADKEQLLKHSNITSPIVRRCLENQLQGKRKLVD
jgi:hypothetical protein